MQTLSPDFLLNPQTEWNSSIQLFGSGTSLLSQFELFDHLLAPQTKEKVVCCQGGHGIPSTVGGTSNVWKNHTVFEGKEWVVCGQGLRNSDI